MYRVITKAGNFAAWFAARLAGAGLPSRMIFAAVACAVALTAVTVPAQAAPAARADKPAPGPDARFWHPPAGPAWMVGRLGPLARRAALPGWAAGPGWPVRPRWAAGREWPAGPGYPAGIPRRLVPGPAGTAPGDGGPWSISDARNVTAGYGGLLADSCARPGACVAVGFTIDSRGIGRALALRSAGTRWAAEPTPAIAGAPAAVLTGVSCPRTSDCTAIGYYVSGVSTTVAQFRAPLVEHWNGRSWSRVRLPVPTGTQVGFTGAVSCRGAALCAAVWPSLVELWNGTRWAAQTLPVPPGGSSPSISGVSCGSARSCTAVGSYTDQAGNTAPLADTWNGTAWTVQSPPGPADGTNNAFYWISCPSAMTCTAAGYSDSATQPVFAARWQAGTWTIQNVPDPSGGSGFYPASLSCSSADRCALIGYYFDPSGSYTLAAADMSTPSGWVAENIPITVGAGDSVGLAGVSCPSATSCTAAGALNPASGGELTLAEAWNGTSWTRAASPDPVGATDTGLNAVSCTGASRCTAVGGSARGLTLAEAWHGGQRWTPQPGPAVSGSLNGVSCVTTRSCIAVGSSSGAPVAEAWDGASWAPLTIPEPAGATNVSLNSVSCPAPGTCTAVGQYNDSTGAAQTLAEAWNGTTWTIEPAVTPAGAGFLSLSSVSCNAPSACVAVGDYYNLADHSIQTLAENWNGIAWAIDTTANPFGVSELSSVSCTAATACTAVGFDGLNALVEAWDGSTWTVQPTPVPPGATGGGTVLTAVSCTAATACTAFGYDYNNPTWGTNFDVAERWNGTTWTLQNTPTPANVAFPGVYPNGLSCTAARSCAAVGTYITRPYFPNRVSVTLALTENGDTAQNTHPPAQAAQATWKAAAGR